MFRTPEKHYVSILEYTNYKMYHEDLSNVIVFVLFDTIIIYFLHFIYVIVQRFEYFLIFFFYLQFLKSKLGI